MDFITSIKTCITKYVDFTGRASRSEFWYFFLFFNVLSTCAFVLDAELSGKEFLTYTGHGVSQSIVLILFILPSISACTRRLHDVGRSGWWQIIEITIIGFVPIILWCSLKTDLKENKYGPPSEIGPVNEIRKTSKIFLALIFLLSIILSAGFGLRILTVAGILPPSSVVAGDDVGLYAKDSLVDKKILLEDENIKFFYTSDLLSFTSDGAVVTDRGLTVYETDEDGSLKIGKMTFGQIKNIKLVEQSFGYVVYKVEGNDYAEVEWLSLILDPIDDEYMNFIREIEARIQKSN